MSGQAILNHLDENDKIIHGDCSTKAELFLEDEEYYQIVLTLDFPDANIQEKAEFYLWHHNKDDSKIIATVFESAVKLAENDLFIHFRLFDENNGNPRKFLGVARLHGALPTNILEGGGFYDLTSIGVKTRLPEPTIFSLATKVRMKGMIHLNYISALPYKLYFNSGECELLTNDIGCHFLRFPYRFPEFQVNQIECIPITGTDFEGEGYYALWFICVQLSAEELLIGFTIFDDRENYPDTIGAFARLRGEIPSTIERKVLM